ncbi:MAG: ATP-binding cassette domain-containing protein [Pirellulales bacterium]|nr:ATP-binding cassette domain-containing protein [Pirellulales bacterium]
MTSSSAISVRDVNFSYGGVPVLEGVSFDVAVGEIVSVVGPNGGGKTTLLKLLLGLLRPASGRIRVLGQSPEQARLRVGYMPQHSLHDLQFPVSVMDVVLMGRLGCRGAGRLPSWYSAEDRRAARAALEQVEMVSFARRSFAELSGGQRQRVLLARALCSQPELLLLDEPTANVDTVAETRLADVLRQLGRSKTILMVSHDLGFVTNLVEKVICVNRQVVVHPTSEISGESIHDLYGHEMRMVRHDQHLCTGGDGHE